MSAPDIRATGGNEDAARPHRNGSSTGQCPDFGREHAFQQASGRPVLGVDPATVGPIGARPRQSIGKTSQQPHRQRQRPEIIGTQVDVEAAPRKPARQLRAGISPEVTGLVVRVRPQPPVRRDGGIDLAAVGEHAVHRSQCRRVVLDVFQHIEQANRPEAAGCDVEVDDRCLDEFVQAALTAMGDAARTRFDEDHPISQRTDHRGDETIAAADIRERQSRVRGKAAQYGGDTAVAVREPERVILHRVAGVVPLLGIGNRRTGIHAPDAVRRLRDVAEKQEQGTGLHVFNR
jgi:hypothetical protein